MSEELVDSEDQTLISGCDDLRCPVQRFEEDEEEEPYISHVMVTITGEVFHAHKSLELEENLPNGDIEIVVAIDALNYPEKGDRSIVVIPKRNIEYTQEFYHKDIWETLMKAAFCSQCEQMAKHSSGTHGIYQ